MLPTEIIRRVREIQIRTGRQVADVLAGEYVSVFKGGGVEFDEVRPYVPGDDVRSIDWNVTARVGSPFVKRYVEERQLTILLVADVSPSQEFGSGARSKREAAAELCALLAFSAIRNDDKVGLVLFHGDVEQYIPPRKGQKHALRVIREVLAHEPAPDAPRGSRTSRWTAAARRVLRSIRGLSPNGATLRPAERGTSIARALDFVLSVTRRRAVCFVISDFLDEGFEKALLAANRKHDVVGVLVTDPRERGLPPVGLVTVCDPETGETQTIDAGDEAFRDAFERSAEERISSLEKRFRRAGIDLVTIDASRSVVDPLVRFFHSRERRQRR